ncbi:hypothetical protein D9M69_597710 [compost metagenome]
MCQPLAVLHFGNEALGRGVGHGVVPIAADVLQGNGQVAGAGVINHEDHTELGQPLENLPAALAGQFVTLTLEPFDFFA